MSGAYEVGYKKPPVGSQFKPGNQAARGRKRKDAIAGLSIPEIIARALNTKRKIKHGNEIVSMPVSEILVERLIQMMTSGSARDLKSVVALMEKYSPELLAAPPEVFEVRHHRAEGSTVALPSGDLWEAPEQ